jgi:uncharacterized membrane-anchored protein YhcB (DUF1043 family)
VNGSLEDLIVPLLIGAIAGLFIGYFTGRRSGPDSEKSRELERQVESLRAERAQFEQQVTTHFADTASKLATLTEHYREVYAHIAGGAAALCSDENRPEFPALGLPGEGSSGGDDAIDSGSVVTEPPRDWAPKSSGEAGTLSESYGVDKSDVPPDHSKDSKA